MNINEFSSKVIKRIKYGCDIEEYSYLNNGSIQWSDNQRMRINLMISTIDKKRMYGGLSTAINFFTTLEKYCKNLDARIIVTNISLDDSVMMDYPDYVVVGEGEHDDKYQIYDYSMKKDKRPAITIRKNDIFLCTFWTTMYLANEIRKKQKNRFGNFHPIIYLIQDYEPGFSKWSSEYLLAESTYKVDKTIAVINSDNLKSYMELLRYDFYQSFSFQPKLNAGLRKVLLETDEKERKNRIVIYGRPFNGRNCFSLIIAALNDAIEKDEELLKWEFWSIGASHKNISLAKNKTLVCKGKLSLEDYGNILKETRVGISMMCSPHPSYPPLEMATFGVRTVTNAFLLKDLSSFNQNIISVTETTITGLSEAIINSCKAPLGIIDYKSDYIDNKDQFTEIVANIEKLL